MKIATTLLLLLLGVQICAQKKDRDPFGEAMNSQDINKVESYMKTLHPQDARKMLLKRKWITLKNQAWTKGKNKTENAISEKKTSQQNVENVHFASISLEKQQPKEQPVDTELTVSKNIQNPSNFKNNLTSTHKTQKEQNKISGSFSKIAENKKENSANKTALEKTEILTKTTDQNFQKNTNLPSFEINSASEIPTQKNDKILQKNTNTLSVEKNGTPEILVDKTNIPITTENEKFQNLVTQEKTVHQEKTVQLLNQLFDNDPTNTDAIFMVQNKSNCNIVLKINSSEKTYDLPIQANGENSVVIKKGQYKLSSSICEHPYFSAKEVIKNQLVILKMNTTASK